MHYLIVGIGGAFGGLTRFYLGKRLLRHRDKRFPVATFIINITGAVLLGIVSAADPGEHIYLLLGDGFLGAYTTFSTFMYEGFNLLNDHKKLNAWIYISASLLLGILGYIGGFRAAALIFA